MLQNTLISEPAIKQELHFYRAFGLNIESGIEMFQLRERVAGTGCDLTIQFGTIDPDDFDAGDLSKFIQLGSVRALFINIPKVATFSITNGNSIIVDLAPDADMQTVKLYLLGSCLGAALHQRNHLVLHGNAIRIGDQAIVVLADSGHGKSTLAGEFHRRGFQVLTDDVCVIDSAGCVRPGYPYLKLWEDAIQGLNLDRQNLTQIRLQQDKYYYPLGESFCDINLPVAGIYILHVNDDRKYEFHNVIGNQKIKPLKRHTYRPQYINQMGQTGTHMDNIINIADQIYVTHLWRPDTEFELAELAKRIQADFKSRT